MRFSFARLASALALVAAAALLPRSAHGQSTMTGPPDPTPTWQKGATLVICSDGTSSTAGNNACALHGGIKAYPGARGPVNAALQMEDHADKWEKKLPPASRGGGTPKPALPGPKPDSTATKPGSAAKPGSR